MSKEAYSKYNLNDPEQVSTYDEVSLWSAPFGQHILDRIRFKPSMHLLDIGCGTGFPLIELAMRIGKGSLATGLDPWQVALDRAAFRIQEYGLTNARLVNGEAENMPFPDESFDLLVSNNGLNNVRDLTDTLGECYRVAKPGAQFVWTMNTDESFRELYDVYRNILQQAGMPDEVIAMQEHIRHKRPPLEDMQAALINAGFSIRDIGCDQFNYRFIDGTAMFNHYFIRLAFMDSWKNILPEAKQKAVFDELELRLNTLASIKGELRMQIPFLVFDCERE